MSPQRFKHMSAVEGLVWNAFLQDHGIEYDSFSYDERVGLGHPLVPGLEDYTAAMIAKVSTHRLDVVGMQGAQATLFEVKDRAARGAIGAAHLYSWLWERAHPNELRPRVAIIAVYAHPEIEAYLRAFGIALYLVKVQLPGARGVDAG